MSSKFSKIGFILAVAGSAVGLGNAWKFPYMVGENGGSAFVILYLLITLTIGISIFFAEISIGKLSESDPVTAYEGLAKKHKNIWKLAGFASIGALLIISFYMVIIGWIMKYTILLATNLPKNIEESTQVFTSFVSSDILGQIFYFSISFVFCFFVVSRGIKNGIERLNVWMMPALGILLLIMLGFSFTMDGFSKSVEFLFVPDFSKITLRVLLDAIGLSFFTLSLGVCTIIAYSASLPDNTDIVKSSVIIILINVAIALVMGLIVFTFVFEFGSQPSQGPGLVFISLPTLFYQLGILGNVLAVMFFIALIFAGLTSAVSMLEPFASYLIGRHNFSRKKALGVIGVFVYIAGVLSLLSQTKDFGASLTFFGKDFFSILDYTSSNLIMPISGIITSIFVGYFIDKNKVYTLFAPYMSQKLINIWFFMLKFVAPICLIIIMIRQII
ncbi:sodium-dependent transporter [Campylobacter geochelonis]|uniref:Sodium-and chloride-dependent transporter n=1 Tax=Campylobacter geochelonis TaxID=1780362 RepID=A0A128EA10_9BACT|nr:sodium-dependent transporter [Campylobacter geochelonis]QKF70681.1 sodium-dependent transporter, SNF family [Campylobacter geochelonis]CZE45795.1 sodium-and chloride-dependent transporter [Campylobacter geochelonis]CZE46846.1 sodium-and chloride-dependent transporter [Campylobacter geochelonis]